MIGRKRAERADQDRTGRLLDALDRADATGDYRDDSPFYSTVVDGLTCDRRACPDHYPPAGHDYPRGR